MHLFRRIPSATRMRVVIRLERQRRVCYPPQLPMPSKLPKTLSLQQLKSELYALENPSRAHFQQGFFKCGPGEYAEGDLMLGISVPVQRGVAKKYAALPL